MNFRHIIFGTDLEDVIECHSLLKCFYFDKVWQCHDNKLSTSICAHFEIFYFSVDFSFRFVEKHYPITCLILKRVENCEILNI